MAAAPDPITGGEPTPADWLKIGNDMRLVLGLKPLDDADRCPTDEELAGWEEVVPGAADRLRADAREEMRHRLRMEARDGSYGRDPSRVGPWVRLSQAWRHLFGV